MTAASGRPGATGSPLRPKTPSSRPSRSLTGASLCASYLQSRLAPVSSLFFSSPPPPPVALPRPSHDLLLSRSPLEARQMSGIRLRHLSVSRSVSFDSRQIEGRARRVSEGGRGGGGEREKAERKRGATFYRWGPVTRRDDDDDGSGDNNSMNRRLQRRLREDKRAKLRR